jgi:hypothetical protein
MPGKENATNSCCASHIIAAMLDEFHKGFSLFGTESSIYIWSKNFSHSAYQKSEAKMAEIDFKYSYEGRKQF